MMKRSMLFDSFLLEHHRLFQQVGHRLRGLRPHRQPLFDGGRVERRLLFERVVETEPLERAALPPVARVDGDEAVEGRLLAAKALEAQL